MIVVAVDPGTTVTAIVLMDLASEKLLGRWYLPNRESVDLIRCLASGKQPKPYLDKDIPGSNKKAVDDSIVQKAMGVDNPTYPKPSFMVMEMVGSYSQAVGRSTFETCIWIGKFIQAFAEKVGMHSYTLLTRTQSRRCMTGTMRSGDPQVRQAIIARMGEQGTKKDPGPLYGVKADIYAAIAVGLTFKDFERDYQSCMEGSNADAIRAGKIKIDPVHVMLEADGGDATMSWPLDSP